MTAITTLRSTIAGILADIATPKTYIVFAYPPEMPVANSVVIAPSSGDYLSPNNNAWATISPMANLEIRMYVPLLDNQGNLANLEALMVSVYNKLAASELAYNIGSVSNVGEVQLDSGSLLSATINISTLTEWS